MKISWNGLGSVTIVGKPLQGEVTLVTNPYQNETGLRFPRTLKASIVVSSHSGPEADNREVIGGEGQSVKPFEIHYAGEFEVRGIFVTGISAPLKDETPHTIYRFDLEDMVVGFLGAIDRKLTDQEIEKLGSIDILLVPSGGEGVLGAKEAAEVVSQIEPRMVIPTYVYAKGMKKHASDAEAICKELSCAREDVNTLSIKKSALPAEDMQIVVLSRS